MDTPAYGRFVFGGFAAPNLAARNDDAQPKLLITADAGMRAGKVIPYKHLVNEALRLCDAPPEVILLRRELVEDVPLTAGRDLDYIVEGLPKTRSGKLLRRSIQALAEGRDPGDLTTLDDPAALDAIRRAAGGETV